MRKLRRQAVRWVPRPKAAAIHRSKPLQLVLAPGRWQPLPHCVRAPVLGLYGVLKALVARPFRLRPARCPRVWAQAAQLAPLV